MSDRDWLGFIEMAFVYGTVFAIAIWQLVSVNRSLKKDKEEEKTRQERDGSDPPV